MRHLLLVAAGFLAVLAWKTAIAAPVDPVDTAAITTYEIQINGETFLVDGNRQATLKSKEKPGITYNVAIRVAPMQRKRLKTLELQYDLPAKAEWIGSRQDPSLRISHELGFSLLIGDVGRGLTEKEQEDALKALEDSVIATIRESKARDVHITEPHRRVFAGSPALGKTIRFTDSKGLQRVCLLYVLAGPKHAATCVVEYLENDSEDVLPLIKKTLDSIHPRPGDR